ncbi:hypothetical protein P154DRAFT_209355 [Amniculicola lignicola CBS 123094]|uniref:Uncharacterized protein n=1 Tax=Amniculicola lignicola CBS 123094 TaxID=1392246 RepID=A0A6A5WE20_9PLEO|nr:hypothetical protein P154DRAFT_209355 [Amniculicola lignicola CBS 123094]
MMTQPIDSDNKSKELAITCQSCKKFREDFESAAGFSHICSECKNFLSRLVTPLHEEPQNPKRDEHCSGPQYPSTGILCNTCIAIPGYLLEEYQHFFSTCVVCGQMTNMVLADLMQDNGEVYGLLNDDGKEILSASKDFKTWCKYVSHTINRKSSEASLTGSVSSTASDSLRRSGAIRRNSSGRSIDTFLGPGQSSPVDRVVRARSSTPSSIASRRSSRHPGLSPLSVAASDKSFQYTRRFSFESMKRPIIPSPTSPQLDLREESLNLPQPGSPVRVAVSSA